MRTASAVQLGLIAMAAAVIPLTAGLNRWSLAPLLVIAVFTIAGELAALDGEGGMSVAGAYLGLILAAIVLGGAPAAAIGAVAITVGWVRWRSPAATYINDLLNYTLCPLLGGLFFHEAIRLLGATPHDAPYYLLIIVAYLVILALNFAVVAGWQCWQARGSLTAKARATVLPTLSAELLTALLTVAEAWIADRVGPLGLALAGIALLVFQKLMTELLTSKRRSDRLERIATTDELTGLANRERFREVVEERIAHAERSNAHFAVLLMDLDRFKEVNDTLGHMYGDRLLRDLGPRLVAANGPGGIVARLGGDEFGILLAEDTNEIPVLEAGVGRLLGAVAEPFAVDELSLEVGASIGVARYPDNGEDSHALLRCADIAMYAAKEAQTDYKLYTADQNHHSVRRLSVLSDIRHALASDQIVVHYQPIVDVENRTVRGAEGLVRWEHPEHGLIPPGAFVQTVEQTGLIGPLTRHVLEHSIGQCARWRSDGRDMSVAVNLSVRNLLDRDLPREIEQMLDSHGVPAEALQLEITESMIMSDPDRAVATVSRLSDLGVRLSVDDFGTGYSSLANLRRLPINELKIDRSFVSPMLQDESDLIIVRSTINLGHDLGLRIIAEGVEDGETLDRLALLGCDLAQGYHLSRPLAASAFDRWLADTPRTAAAAAPASGTPERGPRGTGGWTVSPSGVLLAAPEL